MLNAGPLSGVYPENDWPDYLVSALAVNLDGVKHSWCERHEQVARDGEPTCLDGELDDRNWQGCVLVPSAVIPLPDKET